MKTFCISVLFSIFALMSLYATPLSFSYHGVLRDAKGKILDVAEHQKNIIFKLYSQRSGGTALWGRERSVLLNTNGYFAVSLDDSGETVAETTHASLLDALSKPGVTTFYIGLTVAGGSEIEPRQALLSVPFAQTAKTVSGASGDFSVQGKTTAQRGRIIENIDSEFLTLNTDQLEIGGNVDLLGKTTFAGGKTLTVNGDMTIHGNSTLEGNDSSRFEGYGIIPIGGIVPFSGNPSNIPDGWGICDGKDGRPDLRGRFVYGTSENMNSGDTGGEARHTLTLNELPSHSHSYKYYIANNLVNNFVWSLVFESGGDIWAEKKYPQKFISGDTEFAGEKSVLPHENRPSYRALYYIIREK